MVREVSGPTGREEALVLGWFEAPNQCHSLGELRDLRLDSEDGAGTLGMSVGPGSSPRPETE